MKVVRQVYIYFGSYFFNAAVSFLLVSLLTKYLTPHDYGIINLYSSFLILLMPFISGGILYPLSVEYFKRKDNDNFATHFTDAQVIPLISVCFFTIICVIAVHPLSHFLRVSPVWIYIMPISAWFVFINETSMMMARNKNKPWLFAGFSVGKNFTEMGITIGLVLGLAWSWEGRLSSAVLSSFLFLFLSAYFFFRWKLIGGNVNWKNVRSIFWISLPFVFERLSIFVLGYSDKYFIDKFDLNGTVEVGLYGLASQLASIMFLVMVSMNSAYQPHLFKQLAEGHKGKFHKSTWLYIAACAICGGGLFIAFPILFKYFIGAKFYGAISYAYILTGGYFMWGIYNAFLAYLIYLGKNRQILYISLIGMGSSLLMNALMVPRFGAEGAAITSIAIYSLMGLICFLYTRKYFLILNK